MRQLFTALGAPRRRTRAASSKRATSNPDYLIVGSGIAALRAALELAESGEVLLLTKAASAEGNTGYAQGGIAAAVGTTTIPRCT